MEPPAMRDDDPASWVAFVGDVCIARGAPDQVACAVRRHDRRDDATPALVLDTSTGHHVDLDLTGSEADVARRYARAALDPGDGPQVRRRGRPKLGVVGREITLLPRHWAWLDSQRGGASATLRRLVDDARRQHAGSDRRRRAQDRTQRLMTALAGDRPGFEEACRALYAGNPAGFEERAAGWPVDVRDVLAASAAAAFDADDVAANRAEP